ncbi:hypothetical protein BH11MYX2_BH11MYX2_31730 [soil metagenome]
MLGRTLLLAIALMSCAPTVDGPIERQRVIDQQDARALRAELAVLPGAIDAEVVLHRGALDPLAPPWATVPATTATAVIVVDDLADRAATTARATQLVEASAGNVRPTIIIAVGAHRPELASLGPFVVDASSKGPRKATLAIALALIAGLAGWIALRAR